MPQIRTSRKYATLSDLDASKATGKVVTGLTNNEKLKTPPVSADELNELKKTFDFAIVAADKGGTFATSKKDAARAALINALNKDASYVDINCDEDIIILRSSGFEPVSTNRAQTVLSAPEILGIDYGQTGQLRLRVKGDRNRKVIQGRIKATGGEFGPLVSFRNAREIIFAGLTAGTTYVMQICGLGGSTGKSDWSEPVSKIAL
jgi:hypothetical protein